MSESSPLEVGDGGRDRDRSFLRRNRRASEPLLVRVGIAAGDADVDEGDYFGVPVVEAARLCAAAEGAEVLASDLVRLLAGSRGGFRFESVGELELAGLDRPVPACRIVAEHGGGAAPLPLPPRLAAAETGLFVGREAERAQLSAAWKAVVADEDRRVVLVAGEPGIGKTTLSAALAAEVHADGAIVAYGRCNDDLRIPYQPWIEALGKVAECLSDDEVRAHADERDGSLGLLLPELADRLPEVPAAERWFELALAIHQRVESPLFVAVTEAAWAALRADVGDVDGARRLGSSALAAATARGYRQIVTDATAVLSRLG